MVEMVIPSAVGKDDDLVNIDDHDVLGVWRESIDNELLLIRVLAFSDKAEALIEKIESRFEGDADFRVLIFEVQATLPHPAPARDDKASDDQNGHTRTDEESDENEEEAKDPQRVACAELVQQLSEASLVSRVFVASALLSTLVAAVGLFRDQVVILIGAMVIAPLLTPNMTLALATTLGDVKLARRAVLVNAVGVAISLAVAVLIGLLFEVDPTVGEIAVRTNVTLGDVVLGLASGSAGALAVTTGLSAGLVGVMVAVALLPPLVVAGLMLGSGDWTLAGRAGLLLATNLICVNLAAVVTFLWQGVRPNRWWEAKRAKRMVVYAAITWISLLAILIGLILYAGSQQPA